MGLLFFSSTLPLQHAAVFSSRTTFALFTYILLTLQSQSTFLAKWLNLWNYYTEIPAASELCVGGGHDIIRR